MIAIVLGRILDVSLLDAMVELLSKQSSWMISRVAESVNYGTRAFKE